MWNSDIYFYMQVVILQQRRKPLKVKTTSRLFVYQLLPVMSVNWPRMFTQLYGEGQQASSSIFPQWDLGMNLGYQSWAARVKKQILKHKQNNQNQNQNHHHHHNNKKPPRSHGWRREGWSREMGTGPVEREENKQESVTNRASFPVNTATSALMGWSWGLLTSCLA